MLKELYLFHVQDHALTLLNSQQSTITENYNHLTALRLRVYVPGGMDPNCTTRSEESVADYFTRILTMTTHSSLGDREKHLLTGRPLQRHIVNALWCHKTNQDAGRNRTCGPSRKAICKYNSLGGYREYDRQWDGSVCGTLTVNWSNYDLVVNNNVSNIHIWVIHLFSKTTARRVFTNIFSYGQKNTGLRIFSEHRDQTAQPDCLKYFRVKNGFGAMFCTSIYMYADFCIGTVIQLQVHR